MRTTVGYTSYDHVIDTIRKQLEQVILLEISLSVKHSERGKAFSTASSWLPADPKPFIRCGPIQESTYRSRQQNFKCQ